MTNVLTFPATFLDLGNRATDSVATAPARRSDYSTELSIALTRFELAVGVGSVVGGLVGLGLGATAGCVIGAAPAAAVGAIVGGAAVGIPVAVYSWVQMNNMLNCA